MKKPYIAPEAEIVAFAKEDVITSSGVIDWNTPSIDLGGNGDGDWSWGETYSSWKIGF